VLTIEEDEVEMTTTPFLDGFVGTRDKNNKTKLAGILKETVATLAPSQHESSLKITSVNGAETLLSMIPQSKTESGFVQAAHRSNWLTDVLGHVQSSDADGASSVAWYIAGNYLEQFLTVVKEDAGLTPMESMDTIASEAMIQDAKFKIVWQHVTLAAGDSFNMRYAHLVLDKLEGAQSGPVLIIGVYKNKNENGSVEHCKHWSTLIGEEASFAVENQILNHSKHTKPKATGSLFPKEVEVVVSLDHGQGAMRGFAKFLLTSIQFQKEKKDLSCGCPTAKNCHVQCKKDTFCVIEHMVLKKLFQVNHSLKEEPTCCCVQHVTGYCASSVCSKRGKRFQNQ
jgi:hypothetical protein